MDRAKKTKKVHKHWKNAKFSYLEVEHLALVAHVDPAVPVLLPGRDVPEIQLRESSDGDILWGHSTLVAPKEDRHY